MKTIIYFAGSLAWIAVAYFTITGYHQAAKIVQVVAYIHCAISLFLFGIAQSINLGVVIEEHNESEL